MLCWDGEEERFIVLRSRTKNLNMILWSQEVLTLTEVFDIYGGTIKNRAPVKSSNKNKTKSEL